MNICHVVGTRPNYMKAAPVIRALQRHPGVQQILVHTGQHYDFNMSDVFFQQLEIPAPDINLKVGSSSHAQQTADVMIRFESVVVEQKPDLVLVYGDVNSTVAAALVCSKLGIKVGHVEAGLRSFDRTMPEEINRILTDQLSDLLFTPSIDGNANLAREGVPAEKIFLVGNVMIDTLVRMLPSAAERIPPRLPRRYVLVTLHRPSNVDDLEWLAGMLETLNGVSNELSVIFPVHPRTRQRIENLNWSYGDAVQLIDPLPYLEFLALQQRATVVITDSGGIQEETTFLRVPCLTVRENTERPVTVELGTNEIVGRDLKRIADAIERVLSGSSKPSAVPPYWDGNAAERIADVIVGSSSLRSVNSVEQKVWESSSVPAPRISGNSGTQCV
jgi:UDP-N-acetylglucosamine 2-epimerase (non-hydrolysing)